MSGGDQDGCTCGAPEYGPCDRHARYKERVAAKAQDVHAAEQAVISAARVYRASQQLLEQAVCAGVWDQGDGTGDAVMRYERELDEALKHLDAVKAR